jgi:hypothetical protein
MAANFAELPDLLGAAGRPITVPILAMTICDRLADGQRHVLSRIFGRDTGNRQQHMGRSRG